MTTRNVTIAAKLYLLLGASLCAGVIVSTVLWMELRHVTRAYAAVFTTEVKARSEARKIEVAEKHHLQVVNGKIPVPDLRVEYENPELELRHVDLELATRDYRPRAMADKASAGFSLYARSEDASRLRRVLDEREITAGILTL